MQPGGPDGAGTGELCPLPSRAPGADRKRLEPAPEFCRQCRWGRGALTTGHRAEPLVLQADLTAQARGALPGVTFRAEEPLSKVLVGANVFLGTKGLILVSQPSTPSRNSSLFSLLSLRLPWRR